VTSSWFCQVVDPPSQGHLIVWDDPAQSESRPRLCCATAAGRRDIRLPGPAQQADGGVATRGHDLRNATTAHLGTILGPRQGLLEDSVDILLQLGLVALDDHHVIAAAFHQCLGDGPLRERRIHRDDPSLQEETTQDICHDGALLGLVRDGLLPHGQPQAVTEG